jgi:hypothetical protein
MFGKIGYVAAVVAVVVAITVLMTIMMPTIKSMTDVAANDSTTGNYAGYQEAAAAAPVWIYAVPFLIGGAAIFVRLRQDDS